MGTCLSPESNSSQVYVSLIARIYQDVEKITNRQAFNKDGNFYFGTLQPSLTRKGTVKKLIQHLQSHKAKIATCAKYILSKQFRENTQQLPYFCTILLVLEQLVKNIGQLTQQQALKKKQSLNFLKLPKPRKELLKKQSLKKDLLVSVRSETICLSYERSVSTLFQEFIGHSLTKQMCLSCMNSLKKFSSFELFKFDKRTLNQHLKLLLQLSCPKTDTHTFCFLFLTNLRNFLISGQQEADPDIHYEVLNRTIQIRNRHKQLLENNQEVMSTYKQIFNIYETFLKTPQYRLLYRVPLEELNNNLISPYSLFQFQYNNVLLYVLLNCLLVHSNAEAEELSDLDNFNISAVIDIKQYKNICSIQNRNTIFSILIKYMQYGYNKNQQRFIIPYRKLSACIMANVGISQVNLKGWIPAIEKLFVSIGVSVLNFVKQLGRGLYEGSNSLSDSRLSGGLEILEALLKGSNLLEGQLPSASELVYGCNFRVNDAHSVNLQIAQIYKSITALKLSQVMHEYGREPYIPVFKFMSDFLSIGRFDSEECQSVYGIVMNILMICQNLKSSDQTRANYLLLILDKALWTYNDPDFRFQFKFIYFQLLVGLFKIFKLESIQTKVPNYHKLHEDIRFIYSIESQSNNKEMRNRLKGFQFKPLNCTIQNLLKRIPSYNPSEFHRAKISFGGQQSTKPQQESGEIVQPRARKSSVVFSADVSYVHQQSFANLLHTIQNV